MPDGVSETKCEAFIEFVPLSKDSKVKAVVHLHAFADEDDATTAFVHDIESTLNPMCLELDNRGKCVSISDHDELCRRWDDSLFLLRAKYEGDCHPSVYRVRHGLKCQHIYPYCPIPDI